MSFGISEGPLIYDRLKGGRLKVPWDLEK